MKNVFDAMAEQGRPDPDENGHAVSSPSGVAPDDGPIGRSFAPEVRGAVQELLRQGYVEQRSKPDVFQRVIVHRERIDSALDPLDLSLRVDTHRGIIIVKVRHDEDADPSGEPWSHPLVRRHRMTLEQSLMVAILRGCFLLHEQEVGVGEKPATTSIDDLLPQYLTYVEDSGSDGRNEQKLRTLLEQLKGYGIVSEVDANDELVIRPLIAHLADPASLTALLERFQELAAE